MNYPKVTGLLGGKARTQAMGMTAKGSVKIALAITVTMAFWRLYLARCTVIFKGI